MHEGDENLSDGSYQEQRRVHFSCVVNVSPGTCEVRLSPLKNNLLPCWREMPLLLLCHDNSQLLMFSSPRSSDTLFTQCHIAFAAGGLCCVVPEDR